MASATIPQLPVAISITGAEQLEAVQGGTSVRISALQIASLIGSIPTTVNSLPVPTIGSRAFVTDATSTTFFNLAIGGGASNVPVWADGINWRIG